MTAAGTVQVANRWSEPKAAYPCNRDIAETLCAAVTPLNPNGPIGRMHGSGLAVLPRV